MLKIKRNKSNVHDDVKVYVVTNDTGYELFVWRWNDGATSIQPEDDSIGAMVLSRADRKQLGEFLLLAKEDLP